MRTFLLTTASAVLVSGCGDPLARMDRLSDVELADDAPVRDAVASGEEIDRPGGLLAGLFGARGPETRAEADSAVPAEDVSDETVDGSAAADTLGTRPDLEPERRGFFARLFNPDGAAPEAATDDGVEMAALGPDGARAPQPEVRSDQARGRYGRGSSPASVRPESRAADVPYGTILPFATVGRVCDARSRNKGTRIEASDAGYALYDSAPGGTHPRTFYITGFSDGCPRQFTAALAMFGAPSMHEQLRYGRPSDEYPYSDTDKAYEQVKSAICRVGRRKPCGSRIGTLERNTVFVSSYERFTNNGRWADILVHDGAVLAASLKDP